MASVTDTLQVKLRKNGPEKPRQQQFHVDKLLDQKAKMTSYYIWFTDNCQALEDEGQAQMETAGIESV